MRRHLFIFTILAAACVLLATGVSATDYIKGYHKLQLWGTEEAKTFAAKIDGQVFHTLSSLEDHLATLPDGDSVHCSVPGGSPFSEEPDLPRHRRYCASLQEFCIAHHLKFKWGVWYV